ncbi:hypothetical protein GCM10028814_04480 [Angustibacter aerolatus]
MLAQLMVVVPLASPSFPVRTPGWRHGRGRRLAPRCTWVRGAHDGRDGTDARRSAHAARLLPSGLSPSVLEFHQVNRPLAAVGSRTVTAGSELHRPRSTRVLTGRA